MTEYEAYQEHIRYTHDTYCRIVIRHASFDAARMLAGMVLGLNGNFSARIFS